MNTKIGLWTAMAGLIVLVAAFSAISIVGRWPDGHARPLAPAPAAPAAPKFQSPTAPPERVEQLVRPEAGPPATIAGPQQHEVKKPIDEQQPAFGLPLKIHLDVPEVPREIREPSAPIR
jgi:hypothetical protein